MATGSLVSPGYYSGFTSEDIPDDSIAIIDVRGVITKYWVWWMDSASTVIMTDWVKQAEANPNIKAILFRVDSPGGMVFGTRTFTETIYNCSKPTLAYVNDGMAASCGYWIAAACDHVWVSQSTDMVGSVGTKAVIVDYSGWYESQKIKIHDIKADQSKDKNRVSEEALKGNYKPIKEQELNPMAAQFIEDIKTYRGDRLNMEVADPFTGEVYMYEQAKLIGLVDNKGTMEEALAFLQSSTNSISNNNYLTTGMKFNTKYKSILKTLGWTNAQSEDEAPLVTDERLQLLDSGLETANALVGSQKQTIADHEATINSLKADKQKAEQDLADSKKDLAAMTTERDGLKDKVEKLGKNPGANHNQPKKEGSEGGDVDEDGVKTEQEHFESFAHNQAVLKDIEKYA